MSFKALKTENLTLLTKGKRSQSALEYMMTYGWAILIIVIVAVILYSMGIFNPSSSITTTITGFQSLGVTQAACINSVNNQILELYVTNNVGYPINLTKINVTGNNGVTVTQDIGSLLYAGHSSSFYVNGACNKSSSSYSGSVTITYMEVGQPLPGPYISTGKIDSVPVNSNPNKVGKFSGNNAYIQTNISNIPLGASPRTITAWIYTTNNTQNRGFFGYGTSSYYEDFYAAVGFGCSTDGIWVDAWGTCFGLPPQPLTPMWVFVVYLYNGTAEQGYTGYDGSLSGFGYRFYTFSTVYSPFYIGDTSSGYGGGFNGSMSDVQLYNTALSYSEIKQLYFEGIGGSPISNAGLLGWWPLDGNANDYSANNNKDMATNVNWISP
jgi:hypothetical protein